MWFDNMPKSIFSFFIRVLATPLSIIWVITTGSASIAGLFFASSGRPSALSSSIAMNFILFSILIGVLVRSHNLNSMNWQPLKLKNIHFGRHFNENKVILVLERSSLISEGQILVLQDESEDVAHEVCLIMIEGKTTAGYPQAEIQKSLTNVDLSAYLRDSARWSNLRAVPSIRRRYIERV